MKLINIVSMNTIKLILVALSFYSLLIPIAVALENNPENVMVQALGLGGNLMPMSENVASHTQTYNGIKNTIGEEKAKSLLKKHLITTVSKYQMQWNSNLASSYSALLTQEEMRSLTTLKQKSPYLTKFQAIQGQVGENMQTKSKDLLKIVVSEALNSAFLESVK